MKFLFLFVVLLISRFSFADAWDAVTKEEAEKVVAELKVNPYIFDYCDCCDTEGDYATVSYLVKVKSAEIVPCSWSDEYFSVVLDVEVIGEIIRTDDENEISLRKTSDESVSDFSMNYSWGYNSGSKMAAPFFQFVPYHVEWETTSCKKEFMYPTPKQVKAVSKDRGYAKWYKENIG
jgi:hypothetical protein